jgi:hypothetical protein
MEPDIRWITAGFGALKPGAENRTHIAVPDSGRSALLKMADEIVATDWLVAFYVPIGTEEVYQPGATRGRVVSLVQLIPMPPNGKVEDYFYLDVDGSRRWPIGWPVRVVCAPPVAECPVLREHVESLFGAGSLAGYLKRIQQGPFRLEPAIRERLNRDFARFSPLQ